jgi:hypothetical protein
MRVHLSAASWRKTSRRSTTPDDLPSQCGAPRLQTDRQVGGENFLFANLLQEAKGSLGPLAETIFFDP